MAAGRGFTQSCVVALVIWAALIAAYWYVAWQRLAEAGPALAIAVLGGTFAALLVSSFIGIFTSRSERAAIRRARAMEPVRDGRLEAASGPIRPIDAPLAAPFTGQPCVAYDYDVKRESKSDYAGFALAPCVVDTPRGPARVLGWVMLDEFPAAPQDRIDRKRAVEYLSSAQLESVGLPGLLRAFRQVIADDDGAIRKDFRIGGTDIELQGTRMIERSIPVGTTVTVIGHWSEARQGFVAGGPSLLRLFPRDLESSRKQTGGDALRTFGIAAVLFLILHGILVPMYYLAPGGRAAAAGSVWDERDCDRQQTMLKRGANPNEVGRDAITPLMNSARLSDPDCVANLIDAGARLEDRDKFSDTALAHAIAAGRDDNVNVLLGAGAKDFRVTAATGRAIQDGDAPLAAVSRYIDAVFRGDFDTMARLRAHTSVRRLEDQRENLPFWQSRLPKTFTLDNGWMNEDAATLTIRGSTSSGPQRIVYHVERQREAAPGQAEAEGTVWQIRYEWHPDER